MNDALPRSTADALAGRVAAHMLQHDAAARLLGITLERVDGHSATLALRITAQHLNGHGTCHGGVVFTLADCAFAIACNAANQVAVAAAGAIDFITPARLDETLTACARARSQGRRLGVYDVEVSANDGRLVALFRGQSARLGQPVLGEMA